MGLVDRVEALNRVSQSRTGHLATVTGDGAPHIVVITFAIVAEQVVTAVDHKPKGTTRLKRLANIEENPRVSFLVDHYTEDWDSLWWVRIDGTASILTSGKLFEQSIDALVSRYDQYSPRRPRGPVVSISMDSVSGWQA